MFRNVELRERGGNGLVDSGAELSSNATPRPKSLKELFQFEKEPGIKLAECNGFFGETIHMLTFEPRQVRSILGPFLSSDLTVFYSITQWLHHFIAVGYALFIMILVGETGFPDGSKGESACVSDDPDRNKNICQLSGVLEQATDDFQWLIGFVLAGFVATSVATWASRRKNYAGLCGNARNLNILLSSFVPLRSDDAHLMQTRCTLGRWVMLAMELAMLKARSNMDSDEGYAYLKNAGLIEPGEWEAMVPGDRHSTIFWWMQLEMVRLHDANVVPIEYVTIVTNHISMMRAQANDLMSSLDRDKPYPYVALCGLLVRMNVFIFTSWKAITWSIWYFSFGNDLVNQSKFWVDVAVLFMWNLGYVALYDLGYLLHNPFGNRRIDIAHDLIFGGIRKLSSELANGESHLPPHIISMRKDTSVRG